MVFSVFTMLCNNRHHLIPEHFYYSIKQSVLVLPCQPLVCYLYEPVYSEYFMLSGIIQYVAFYVWLLSLSIRYSRCNYFIYFYGWIVFHWADISYFVYPFNSWWTFELFLLFRYMTNIAMNTYIQVFIWIYVGYIFRRTAGSYGNSVKLFEKPPNFFWLIKVEM